MTSAVELRDVTVVRRNAAVLQGITLDFFGGDFVGILGPNGAGKTTLLSVINGLVSVRSGTVRVLGEALTPAGAHRLRRRIGYVPQLQRLDPRAPVSCREAVAIGRCGRAGLLRRLGPADHAAVERALGLAGITHLADRPVGRVSGGEAQKVAIARALAQEPEILLLDEPTASLDRGAVKEILALVCAAWRDLKLTVALVTHQPERLPGDCNRVVLLRAGQVSFFGPRGEALLPARLTEVYGDD